MAIQVVDLNEDEERQIPNPIVTFGQAFAHHRK